MMCVLNEIASAEMAGRNAGIWADFRWRLASLPIASSTSSKPAVSQDDIVTCHEGDAALRL
jgi:hypothetical protein